MIHFLFLPQSKQRPIQNEDSIYSNWMETMTTIYDDITESQVIMQLVSEVNSQLVLHFLTFLFQRFQSWNLESWKSCFLCFFRLVSSVSPCRLSLMKQLRWCTRWRGPAASMGTTAKQLRSRRRGEKTNPSWKECKENQSSTNMETWFHIWPYWLKTFFNRCRTRRCFVALWIDSEGTILIILNSTVQNQNGKINVVKWTIHSSQGHLFTTGKEGFVKAT